MKTCRCGHQVCEQCGGCVGAPSAQWSGRPPRLWGGEEYHEIPASDTWETPAPYGGKTYIDAAVSRVLKFFSEPGDPGEGWKFLEGWSHADRVDLVKKWIKSIWPTPRDAQNSVVEMEEEFAILFIAWLMGWNLNFGGKRLEPCWYRYVTGANGYGTVVPSGYRWNPWTRSCEKIPNTIVRV